MRVTASAALLALRMWWLMIAALVVIGAMLGVLAVRDSPYAAVTTLRVDTAGFGEVAQQSIVETTRELIDSNRVYAKVAGEEPGAIEELRQRTTVDPIASSSVLEITVSAQTAEQAERDVDALANASITVIRELADEQYTAAGEAGREALQTGELPDPVAEQSRRDQIGTSIAAQQDNALRLSAQLTRIGEVLPATPTGLGSRIAAVIGGLTGALIGAVLALFAGVGRRRIRRLADVHAVAPGLVPCEPMTYDKGVMRVAAECSRLADPLVVVLALPGAEDDLSAVVDELRSALYADGNQPFRIDATDALVAETEQRRRSGPAGDRASQLGAAVPALGMPQRAKDLAKSGADSLLVTGEAEDRVITMIADRADIILLVAHPRVSKLGQLARVTTGLGDGRPPVVVLAGGPAGERDGDSSSPHGRETLRPAPIRPRVTDQPTMPAFEPVAAGQRVGERTGRGYDAVRVERLRPMGRPAPELASPTGSSTSSAAADAVSGARVGRGATADEPPVRPGMRPPLGGPNPSDSRSIPRPNLQPDTGPDDESRPVRDVFRVAPPTPSPQPTPKPRPGEEPAAVPVQRPAEPAPAAGPPPVPTVKPVIGPAAKPVDGPVAKPGATPEPKPDPKPVAPAAVEPTAKPAPAAPKPSPRPTEQRNSLFMPEAQATLKIRALDRADDAAADAPAKPATTGEATNGAAKADGGSATNGNGANGKGANGKADGAAKAVEPEAVSPSPAGSPRR